LRVAVSLHVYQNRVAEYCFFKKNGLLDWGRAKPNDARTYVLSFDDNANRNKISSNCMSCR